MAGAFVRRAMIAPMHGAQCPLTLVSEGNGGLALRCVVQPQSERRMPLNVLWWTPAISG